MRTSPGSKVEVESLEGAAGRGRGGAQGSDRIPAAIRWGRGRRAGGRRVRTWALAAALIIVACLAVWGPVRGLASFRPAWSLGTASSTRPSAPAVSSGSPSVSVSPSTPGSASATAPVPRPTQGDAEGMVNVVVTLSAARDRALMAADAGALAATTVVQSPAAEADSQLLDELLESGESVEGLQTSVSQVVEVELPNDAAALWPSARAVRVTLSQSASTRSGPSGRRTVPAPSPRQVVLVLVPEPWRVADIRAVT